jgi:radical SAM superfamily enzyme YgiQ (UPF0313 family)
MKSDTKVLLISPKLCYEVAKKVAAPAQENLGIGYLASFLESKNVGVDIVDLNSTGIKLEQLINNACNPDYSVIGISVHSPYDLKDTLDLSKKFKTAGAKAHITLGGHYATKNDLHILSNSDCVDSVVRDEGELTLYDLYFKLNESSSLHDISGLSFKANGEIVQNKKREAIKDLDALPFPKRYNLENLLRFKPKSAHILTSRGCPGGCTFCVASLNKGWRTRSAGNVIDEIRKLYSAGIRTFIFEDDNYLGRNAEGKERASKIADELINLNLGIKYQFSSRADGLDDELIKKFVDSGVFRMRVGIESFNQRQLNWYNKRVTSEQVVDVMQKIIRSGIEPHFSFITFEPYVSLSELEKTIQFMREFANYVHYRYVIAPLDPIEGSVAWKRLKEDNLLIREDNKYFFKFVNSNVDAVWSSIKSFRGYMADVENKYLEFAQRILLFNDNEDNAKLLKLKKLKKEIDFKMTVNWLDILQYSIDAVKENNYEPANIPNKIKQQHSELLGWFAQNEGGLI